MKNVCVVLQKNGIGAMDQDMLAPMYSFTSNGYFFEEIRTLDMSDEKRVKTILTDLKKECNILLLTASVDMLYVNNFLSTIFSQNSRVNSCKDAAIYQDEKTLIFVLATDNDEMGIDYAERVCIPYLRQKSGQVWERIVARSIGAGEMHVSRLIAEICQNNENIKCVRRRKFDEEIIEVFYNNQASKMQVDGILRKIAEQLGDTIYALDDMNIEEQLIQLLKLRRRTVSVAESFTGGGIAKRLTSVSGASEVYFEGLNTYDERSKKIRLGVSDFTLNSFGAVSEKTAYEMALGLLNTNHTDIAIATTGLAGPKSDRSMLPVGLCFIAVGTKERILVYRYKFDGNRKEITEKAINYALFLAYKQLKNL